MKKISVVIPNYNGKALLEKNIPLLFDAIAYYKKATNNEVEVIVIDDYSSDSSVEVLKKLQETYTKGFFHFYQNKKNKGFSPTINHGVSMATGEIVVLLNTDVQPEKDFLIPLLAHFSTAEIFAVGCMDKSIEEGKTVLRGRGLAHWRKGYFIHRAGDITKTNTMWVNGGSGAFRTSIWEKLGGFIELYSPFYWEDIDLSYRALKAGYHIVFEPKSIVTHKHEEGSIKKQFSQKDITRIAYRNQFIFIWINATDKNILLEHLISTPYYLFMAALRKDFTFIQGFYVACMLLPKILPLRHAVQKITIKSDQEVMSE